MARTLILILVSFQLHAMPINFYQVEPGLYRGGQPAQLSELNVKTVIDLNSDDDAYRTEKAQADQLGITHINVPLSGFWEPSKRDMQRIEYALENAERPIYIHCQHGQDRTGLAIAEYRLHEGWKKSDARAEMLKYGFHTILLGLEHYWWEH